MPMQLEKVVQYHKALADPTRIKLLILLADGERNGQELAERLAVTPATVTHHSAKLREAGLIYERREKNTVYFKLNRGMFRDYAEATEDIIRAGQYKRGDEETMEERNKRMKQSALKNFFTAEGRLKQLPVQLKKKLIVLEELVLRLETGRKYTEKEINEFIKTFHEDYATIRREFIMHQFLYREKEMYEVNPVELWTKWEQLS
jgi:hypothetical protein